MQKETALVLVVDDDPKVCYTFQQIIARFEIKVDSTSNPLEVLDLVKGGFYNVIFLDIMMPEKSGLELLLEIVKVNPDTKIIMITGLNDRNLAIRALRLGAFDFLEKPFDYKLLGHSIQRALQTQTTELAYKHEKEKLQIANRRLSENNQALSTLARNIERTRSNYESNIGKKIRASILPIIENLQQSKGLSQAHRSDVNLLMDLITDLALPLNIKMDVSRILTETELRVALLIKNGLTTNKIAEHIHISPETVKTHRKNIRKKLGLNKSHHTLCAHLRARFIGKIAGQPVSSLKK